MHNLKTNFDKFFQITKSFFSQSVDMNDNFQNYIRLLKVSDIQIIALWLTAESTGNDTEN